MEPRIESYDSNRLHNFHTEIRIGGKEDFRVNVTYADVSVSSGRFYSQLDAILAAKLVERFLQAIIDSELLIDCSQSPDLAAHLRAIVDSM